MALVLVATCCAVSLTDTLADGGVTRDLVGHWGGRGVRAEITQAGASLEFGCGGGTISESLVMDEQGFFRAAGTYRVVYVGPRTIDRPPPPARSVVYTGWTDGEVMDLTITATESDERLGEYRLVRGEAGQVEKCV